MPEPTVDVDAVPRPDGPEKKYLDLVSDSLTGSLDGPGLVRPRSSGRKSAGHRPRGPCARAMEPLYRPVGALRSRAPTRRDVATPEGADL